MASTADADDQGQGDRLLSHTEEEEEAVEASHRNSNAKNETSPESIMPSPEGLRASPDDTTNAANVDEEKGQKVNDEIMLKNPVSEPELKKHEEDNKEKEASLKAAISEEKDPELERPTSDVEMQEIPEDNQRPASTDDLGQERRFSSLSEDSEEGEEETSNRYSKAKSESSPGSILGLRVSTNNTAYVVDENGQKIKYEKILKNAFSESELRRHDEYNKEKEASLRAAIREQRRREEKLEMKRATSDVEMQEMAMRFIPEYNQRPARTDPVDLFEHIPKLPDPHKASQKGVEFVSILEPTFPVGKVDSLATVPSTVARKFSNDSVRGSALSTRLSDMPSMFSQALVDDPSAATFMTPSGQALDISPKSVAEYRRKWLEAFMSGYTPKQTFTISILNMITRNQTELRVSKENTLNEICHMYMQYEDHPEYYVWKDIYGRLLVPDKTLVENGLLRLDEVLEFQGYRRLPVILLYFRDGFESDPPLPLNPIHALKQREPGLCRNY